MAGTYKDVQEIVKLQFGFVPKSCWIAHVLELSGQQIRMAWNRRDRSVRQVPCPPEKRGPIESVMRQLRML